MAQAADRAAAALYQQVRVTPKIIQLPSLRGIGAGLTATALLPTGITYHAIQLRCTIAGVEATPAEIIAQVEDVKLTLNGDAKIDASAAEIAALHRFWRTKNSLDPIANGILTVWLARPELQEIDGQDGPAWGTLDQNSFNLDVKLAAGATIDAIEPRGWVSKGEPLGRHITIRRLTDFMAGAGDKVLSDFQNPNAEYQMLAIHIDRSGGAGNLITSLNLKADQVDEWDGPYGFIQNLLGVYGFNQQSGWTHLPFAMRGRPLDSLPMVMNDLRLRLTCSGALNNFNVLQERIEGIA
jgi:hypothetical protein